MNIFYKLLGFVLPTSIKEEVLGDLHEVHYKIKKQGKSTLESNWIIVRRGIRIAWSAYYWSRKEKNDKQTKYIPKPLNSLQYDLIKFEKEEFRNYGINHSSLMNVDITKEFRRQTRFSYNVAIGVTTASSLITLVGIGLLISNKKPEGMFTLAGGLSSTYFSTQIVRKKREELEKWEIHEKLAIELSEQLQDSFNHSIKN